MSELSFDRCFSFRGENRWFGVWSLKGKVVKVGKEGFPDWIGKELTKDIRPYVVEKQYRIDELKS